MIIKKKESMENSKKTEEKEMSLHLGSSLKIRLAVFWAAKLEYHGNFLRKNKVIGLTQQSRFHVFDYGIYQSLILFL